MKYDPATLAKTVAMLAVLGLVVIVATRVVSNVGGKAAASLPG